MDLRAKERIKVVFNHLDRSGVKVVSFFSSVNVFTRGFFRPRDGALVQGSCMLPGDTSAPELGDCEASVALNLCMLLIS